MIFFNFCFKDNKQWLSGQFISVSGQLEKNLKFRSMIVEEYLVEEIRLLFYLGIIKVPRTKFVLTNAWWFRLGRVILIVFPVPV